MNEIFTVIKDSLKGLTGIVVQFVALVAAILALIKLLRELAGQLRGLKSKSKKRKGTLKGFIQFLSKHVFKSGSFHLILISGALFATVVWVRSPQSPQSSAGPINQEVTTRAWLAFEQGQDTYLAKEQVDRKAFMRAIRNADFVINNYSGMASNQQVLLLQTNAPVPPIGKITSELTNEIFARGLINDVGTCYFIVGRSYEYLGQTEQARSAYQAATNYIFARTWNPRGQSFWSPAEAAAGRLAQMPKE